MIVANHPVGVECDACSLGGSLLLVLSWAVVNVVVAVIVAMKRTMVECLMVICIFMIRYCLVDGFGEENLL